MITKKNILQDPDPMLRTKTTPVDFPISDETKEKMSEMREYIINSLDEEKSAKFDLEPAMGIAAPQVGLAKQFFIVYLLDGDDNVVFDEIIINPKIISYSAKEVALESGEACLSIGEKHQGYVYRPYKIKIKYKTIDNKEKVLEASDLLSIVLQHEYDHLKGILYYDRINKDAPLTPKENSILI